jgi:MFS family permease
MHDPHSERMSSGETRAASGLALVFAFRMLGMFMVLPVLATYGMDLAGATPALIGLAIGAYGLTQAFLQIPFGVISDRIGRRPVIYGGLVIFAIGSVVAAQADSIWGVIAGRILQGAGAISAAVMALLSDLTREQNRTKAMAMIGMSIGVSFAVAMVVGPLLTRAFGLHGLFLATGVLALVGIALVAFVVPKATAHTRHRESGVARGEMLATLKHPDLLRLDLGIFVLHSILMASFVALPLALVERAGLPKEEHWWVYLTALVVSFFAMIPFIIYGEKKRKMKRVLLGAVATLMLVELFFWEFGNGLKALVIGTVVFFTAFNLLEASLPSLISKVPGVGHGRHPRRLVVPAWRPGCGLHRMRGAVRPVVGHSCYYARTTLRDQSALAAFAPSDARDGIGRAVENRARCNRCGGGGRRSRHLYQIGQRNFGSHCPRAPGQPSADSVRSLGERYGPWG